MYLPTIRQSNPEELRAFDEACLSLQGFDASLNSESVDGFLTALAAARAVPPADLWLPALCGDVFERAFADPSAHAAALRALKARLAVLCDQLDPEALMADIDADRDVLRLAPLMLEWNDANRALAVAETGLEAAAIATLLTGFVWAGGFISATQALPELWQPPENDEQARDDHDALLGQIVVLNKPESDPEVQAYLASLYPPDVDGIGAPTRDDLVNDALYAVQDLRLFWVEHAPRPVTRQVAKAPGRNDPCPCGSGRKYKKCHGMAQGQT